MVSVAELRRNQSYPTCLSQPFVASKNRAEEQETRERDGVEQGKQSITDIIQTISNQTKLKRGERKQGCKSSSLCWSFKLAHPKPLSSRFPFVFLLCSAISLPNYRNKIETLSSASPASDRWCGQNQEDAFLQQKEMDGSKAEAALRGAHLCVLQGFVVLSRVPSWAYPAAAAERASVSPPAATVR